MGDPRETDDGGGTYGFGKAVFFRASEASTIVVHTRCRNEHDEVESRLVGCALGSSYESDGCVHTGRRWFGIPDGANNLEPIRGEDADAIAKPLGFPPLAPGEFVDQSPPPTSSTTTTKTGPSACSRTRSSGTRGPRWSHWRPEPGDGVQRRARRRRARARGPSAKYVTSEEQGKPRIVAEGPRARARLRRARR